MKKIIALILVLSLSLFCFAACKKDKDDTNNDNNDNNNVPTEKTYSLAIAVDSSVGEDNKVTNYVAVLVLDADSKIVAARIDCAETTVALENGAIKDVASVATKVELGDSYAMTSGSFAKQTKAFEDYIVGKNAAEVAAIDLTLVTGCTMPYSPFSFKTVVAKAFATANKVSFKTSETITVGASASMKVSEGKATADFAGVVMAGGKVVAAILDSNEHAFTVADGAIVAGEYTGTKADKGDAYVMPAGNWKNQAQAFANSAVGKTAAELQNLEAVSDALASAGCTMQWTTYGYKATIIKAANAAR